MNKTIWNKIGTKELQHTQESWLDRNGLKVMKVLVIALITIFVLEAIVVIAGVSSGMTLSPIIPIDESGMYNEDCIAVKIGILSTIQFMCP